MLFFHPDIKFLYSDYATYYSNEPHFYNPVHYPSIQAIERAFPIIQKEVLPYINGERHIEAKNPNAPDVNYPDTWKHAYFMNYQWHFPKTKKLFPETWNILSRQKDITLAGIAVLEGGGKLLPHVGETNAIIRCHLGIKIPAPLPQCGIRVNNEKRGWEEGKVICFNDAFNHEAWNLSKERRFILLFDIVRPEFMYQKNLICAYSLGIASSRYVLQVLGVKRNLPDWLRQFLVVPFALLWLLYIKINNIFMSR
jgi:aspartyl/asparaginyl beta-hydroxylase (cupin superfamily)